MIKTWGGKGRRQPRMDKIKKEIYNYVHELGCVKRIYVLNKLELEGHNRWSVNARIAEMIFSGVLLLVEDDHLKVTYGEPSDDVL